MGLIMAERPLLEVLEAELGRLVRALPAKELLGKVILVGTVIHPLAEGLVAVVVQVLLV
jgi:hypothetical protein